MRDIYNCTCREAGGMHIDNWNIKGRHDRFFFQENIYWRGALSKRDAQKFYSALPVIYKSTKKKSDVSRNVRRMRSERVNLFFVSLSLFAWLRTFWRVPLRKFSRFRPLKMRERYQPIIATTTTLHKKGRQEKGCPLYSNITSYAMLPHCLSVCLFLWTLSLWKKKFFLIRI